MTADHYTYRVHFSAADGEYVATVAEFASLSWLDSGPAGALLGLMQVVTDVVEDLRTSGEPVPAPLGDREYSGKFMVRIPPEAHRRLAIEAAEQHVSLNRLIADRLAVA